MICTEHGTCRGRVEFSMDTSTLGEKPPNPWTLSVEGTAARRVEQTPCKESA